MYVYYSEEVFENNNETLKYWTVVAFVGSPRDTVFIKPRYNYMYGPAIRRQIRKSVCKTMSRKNRKT